jgi:hypothetical protein
MCRCGGFGSDRGGGGGGGYVPPTVPVITPAWFRVGNYTYADFSTDNDEFQLSAAIIPAKGVIHGVLITPVTQFAGPGLTSLTMEAGIPGDLARYQSPVDLLSVVPGDTVQIMSPPLLDQVAHVGLSYFFLTARSTGSGLDSMTAGAFHVDWLISVTP